MISPSNRIHHRNGVGCVVAGTGLHEVFNSFYALNAASCPGCHAIQSRCCAGEIELPFERPVLKQAIDESGMEDVAGAGGIDDGHAVSGSVIELLSVPCDNSVRPEGRRRKAAFIAALYASQSFFEIDFAGEAAGEITAYDGVVNIFKQLFYSGIEFIEISDYRDACAARPAGRERGCSGVMAVDEKRARMDHPFAIEVARLQHEPLVFAAEHGALACAINQNQRLRACAAGDCDELRFNSGFGKGLAVKIGCAVVAKLADVACLQAPTGAGHGSSGHLAAGEHGSGL